MGVRNMMKDDLDAGHAVGWCHLAKGGALEKEGDSEVNLTSTTS